MKTLMKILMVLGLLVWIFNISSAQNNSVSTTHEEGEEPSNQFTKANSLDVQSRAIADTVYEALKMVINGITTLINGIGHLLTNLVKRLCQLLDQLTKPRWKRSTMSTFGNQEEGTWKLIRFFFQVIGNILSIITYPLRSIFALVTSLFPLIYGSFGDRNSTSSFMPTDLNIRNIRDMLVRDIWYFVKQNVIPQLDIVATKLIESNMIPNNLKTILSNFHGVHNLLKMLDYVR